MAAWRLSKYDLGHISSNKTDLGSLSGGDHLELARDFADQAVRIAPNDACCQTDLEFVKFWRNEAIESAWHFDCSLDALPFHPEFAADAGMRYSYIGRKWPSIGLRRMILVIGDMLRHRKKFRYSGE